MKTIPLLSCFLLLASGFSPANEILTTKRVSGVVSYPATAIVNSAIFETDGSGNVVMTPKSVYATAASLTSYAQVSTAVTLTGTQTLTNKSISSGQITGLGALATVTPGTNVATALGLAADATGGIFRQGQALSGTTGTFSGAVGFSGGGSITGASGAVTIAASGTNQNIILTPSGTGSVTSTRPIVTTSFISAGSGVGSLFARQISDGIFTAGLRFTSNSNAEINNGNSGGACNLAVNGNLTASGTVTGTEQGSTPAAPAANGYALYAEDNGSGKTRLMVRFATGAAQQLAIEP